MGFSIDLPASAALAIANDPRVRYVEEDAIVTVSAVQGSAPSGLDRIDQRALPLDQVYSYPSITSAVNVHVMDTGHPHDAHRIRREGEHRRRLPSMMTETGTLSTSATMTEIPRRTARTATATGRMSRNDRRRDIRRREARHDLGTPGDELLRAEGCCRVSLPPSTRLRRRLNCPP